MRHPEMEPTDWLEQYFIGSLKVDIGHLALEWTEGELRGE